MVILSVVNAACVKREYNLNKELDLTIRIGGESIFIPIGSTDSLFLKNFINLDSIPMFDTLPNGGYAIVLDSFISLDIPEIDPDMLRLDDIKKSQSVSFELEGVDELRIPAIKMEETITIDLSDENFPTPDLPIISETVLMQSGLWKIINDHRPLIDFVGLTSSTFPIGDLSIPTLNIDSVIDISVSIPDIPEQILGVDTIWLKSGSELRVVIKPNLFPNVTAMLNEVKLTFPNEMGLVQGGNVTGQIYTTGGKLLENVNDSLEVKIPIRYFIFSNIPISSERILEFEREIEYFVDYSIGGNLLIAELPKPMTVNDDFRLELKFSSNLQFESATIDIASIPYDLANITVPLEFATEIPSIITSVGDLTLSNSIITVEVYVPNISDQIGIRADSEGIDIIFPSVFGFLPGNPNLVGNTYKINAGDPIPEIIQLTLEKLNGIGLVVENDSLKLQGEVKIIGGIETTPGKVNSSEFDNLVDKNIKITATTTNFLVETLQIGTITETFKDTILIAPDPVDIPSEIMALDSVLLESAQIKLVLKSNNIPTLGGKPIQINVQMELPEMIVFAPGQQGQGLIGNTFNRNINFNEEILLNIKGLKLPNGAINTETGKLTISEEIFYTVTVSVDNPNIGINELNANWEFGFDAEIKNIIFSKVYGKIDPNIEKQYISVALADELPQIMRDNKIVLDVKPTLSLVLATNLQIPVEATVLLIPWKNGDSILGETQRVRIPVTPSPSTGTMQETKVFIAQAGTPVPSGYTLIPTPLGRLIKEVPDSLQIEIDVHTNSSQSIMFDPNPIMPYKAEVSYRFEVPLAFYEDFEITIQDTIGGSDTTSRFPPIVGEFLAGNKIGLSGTIWNSIPLQLEGTLIPIDSLNRPIESVTITPFIINAGAKNNTAVKTDLSFTINDPYKKMDAMRGFIYRVTGRTGQNAIGEPIRPTNFIQLQLRAEIHGGATVDLRDFINKNNEE